MDENRKYELIRAGNSRGEYGRKIAAYVQYIIEKKKKDREYINLEIKGRKFQKFI